MEDALAKAEKALAEAKSEADKADGKVEDLGESATKAARKVDDLGDESKQTGSEVKSFGDIVGDTAKDRLGPLGDVADKAGIDLGKIPPVALAGGAALVGLGTAIAGGIEKIDALVTSTRQYKDAANLSWEEASRLGGAFHDMGVEAEDGADVLKTLAEEAGDAPEKFAEFGVEIARTKDGAVDMTETLKNVAARFQATADPTRRAAMGAALFGDTWLRIAPMLERGSAGVQALIDGVDESRIVTKETADSHAEYKKAMRELGDAVGDLQVALATKLLPELAESASGLAKLVNWANKADEKLIEMGQIDRSVHHLSQTLLVQAEAMGKVALAAGPAALEAQRLAEVEEAAAAQAEILKRRHEDLAKSSEDAARALDEQRKSLSDLNNLAMSINSSDLALEQANVALGESMDTLAEKQDAVTDAINEFGQDSPEAAKAVRDYEKSLLDTRGSADNLARAEVERAKKQAEIAGQTLTDAEAVDIYKASIERTRDTTNDPNLAAGLDNMARRTGAVADAADVAARKLDAAEAAARRLAAVTAGVGTTSGGSIVGSADRLERTITRQSTAAAPAAAAPVTNNTINVQAQTNANPWDIAAQVDWALRTGGR
ncbi:MAG: hypothetical protein AB7O95_13925 [Geminicoccaceae bacterium]